MLKTYKNVYSKLLRADKKAPLVSRVELYMDLLQQLAPSEETNSTWQSRDWTRILSRKKNPNTLFIAPILNRHTLRQHSPQTGIKKASFTSCAFKIHLFFYHLHHKTWIVKFYENLNPRRRYWIVIIGPKLLLACQPPTHNKTKAHSMSEHSKSLLSQRDGTERWDKVFTVHFNILFPIKQPASLLICSLPCAILCWQWWMKTQRLACVHCCTCVFIAAWLAESLKIKYFS